MNDLTISANVKKRNVFKESFNLQEFGTNKHRDQAVVLSIVSSICAFLNDIGAWKLKVDSKSDSAYLPTGLKGFMRVIEQKLCGLFGCSTVGNQIHVSPSKKDRTGLIITVEASHSLFHTVNYNLYFPTETQIILIPPTESPDNIKSVLFREVINKEDALVLSTDLRRHFVYKKQFPLQESARVQFKNLKSEKSKCVSLADRIVSKSNKLDCYISAFANKHGGQLFYGITCEGLVEGEIVQDKDRQEIIRKVSKTIGNMVWYEGDLKKGKHWDIEFVPVVQDESMNEIASLFVVTVLVAPLPGGLFTREPESYHVVHGRVQRMSFTEWKDRFSDGLVDQTESSHTVQRLDAMVLPRAAPRMLKTSNYNNDKQLADADIQEETEHVHVKSLAEPDADIVPSYVGRSRWSSVHAQKVYHTVSEKLVKARNDGNLTEFERCAKWAEREFSHEYNDVNLIILAERVAYAYRSGQYKKAKELLKKFEEFLSSSQDIVVFKFKAVYAKSAIARAEGKYKESYSIAIDGLQLAQQIPAGIVTAWFFNHVALVETLLLQSAVENAETRKISLQKSAHGNFITALQHAQASSIEQEFCISMADLRQRVHINQAIALLGHCFNGDHRSAINCDIKAAKENLAAHHGITLEGHSQTHFREIHHNFALSDLSAYQWQLQEYKQRQTQDKTSFRDREMPEALLAAFGYAKKALTCASDCRFEEMIHYAKKRVAALTETMLRHKISCIRFKPSK